jgi:hypothetical protein
MLEPLEAHSGKDIVDYVPLENASPHVHDGNAL